MNQREDFHESIKIKERLYEQSVKDDTRLHPSEQVRQRPGHPFALLQPHQAHLRRGGNHLKNGGRHHLENVTVAVRAVLYSPVAAHTQQRTGTVFLRSLQNTIGAVAKQQWSIAPLTHDSRALDTGRRTPDSGQRTPPPHTPHTGHSPDTGHPPDTGHQTAHELDPAVRLSHLRNIPGSDTLVGALGL